MPKSRKKKAKHQDFQKVKLKVGRKLPRSANETVATFQSKGIQLKEQFSTGDNDQPTSKRNLSLKELLSQLHHYSSSVRHEALTGMREILSSNPSSLHDNLSSILERLSDLFVDKDGAVRSGVHKLLKLIFPAIDETQIAPFFPMLSAQVCCAMTHIYSDIQADSLPILDICLDHYPLLVTKASGKILPNFLEQISKQGTSRGSRGKERTLITNPHSRITNQKWRLQVLARVEKFLSALIRNCADKNNGDMDMADDEARQALNPMLIWSDSADNSVQVLGTEAAQNTQSHFMLRDLTIGHAPIASTNQMPAYIQTLVPLLVDCWVEAGPAQLTSNLPGNVLSVEALSLLQCVVNILHLMLEYMQLTGETDQPGSMQWFMERYQKELTQQIFSGFPYSMHSPTPTEKLNRGKANNNPVSVVSLNLSISMVMSRLLWDSSAHRQQAIGSKNFADKIPEFMTSLFGTCKLGVDQMEVALKISQRLVNSGQNEGVGELLEAVLSVWKRRHPLSNHNLHLNNFFSWLVLHCPKQELSQDPAVQHWLSSLPSYFIKVVSLRQEKLLGGKEMAEIPPLEGRLLLVMQRAGARGQPALIQALELIYLEMLTAPIVKSLDASHQRRIMDLLLVLPLVTEAHYRALVTLWREDVVGCDLLMYVIQILHHRFSRASVEDVDLNATSLFIQFLVSIVMGKSPVEVDEGIQMLPSMDLAITPPNGHIVAWQGHLKVTQMVYSALYHLGHPHQLFDILLTCFQSVQSKCDIATGECVYSLIYLATQFSLLPGHSLTPEQSHLLATALVAMLALSVTMETDIEQEAGEIVSDMVTVCCSCLNQKQELVGVLLKAIQHYIKGSECDEVVARTMRSLVKLLQLPSLHRGVLQPHQDVLLDILHAVKASSPQLQDSALYNSLSYEVSLIK